MTLVIKQMTVKATIVEPTVGELDLKAIKQIVNAELNKRESLKNLKNNRK